MIAGTQLIYRLKNAVRLLIDYRPGVDAFNFYWSATELGAYTLFAENLTNQASLVPPTKGKVLFEFYPSLITLPVQWDNDQTNYIKIAEVIGGVVGAQEGPMAIPTRTEMIGQKDQMVAFGFNKDSQKFIPLAVDVDGKLL
jgi:hypothetical protein